MPHKIFKNNKMVGSDGRCLRNIFNEAIPKRRNGIKSIRDDLPLFQSPKNGEKS